MILAQFRVNARADSSIDEAQRLHDAVIDAWTKVIEAGEKPGADGPGDA